MSAEQDDGRLSFDEAVHHVQQHPGAAAFAAVPVFGEDEDAAEGARVFVLEADGAGSWQMHFVAGPFFANAFAANETVVPDEVPESVRELRFLTSRLDKAWLDGQVQILIQNLMQASGKAAPQMPDYAAAPATAASPETTFPISFIGREGK